MIIQILILVLSIINLILVLLSKKSETYEIDLTQLPINRYPWIGSHDAATGFKDKNADSVTYYKSMKLPFVKTQNLDFYNQYKIGKANFFDLRGKIEDGRIRFNHGIINLQFMDKDNSLELLLQSVIKEKKIIVLWFNHFKESEQQINTSILKYLQEKNIPMNYVFFLNEISDLDQTYQSYLNNNKYILILTNQNLIRGNWKEDVVCFDRFITPFIGNCENNSCLGDDDSTWKNLYNYIDNINKEYNIYKPKQFYVTQTMFQAPNSTKGIQAAIKCLGQDSQPTLTEERSKANFKIGQYINKKGYKPNVVLVDNIGNNSALLESQIIKNFK